jgi:hypothetical protein
LEGYARSAIQRRRHRWFFLVRATAIAPEPEAGRTHHLSGGSLKL